MIGELLNSRVWAQWFLRSHFRWAYAHSILLSWRLGVFRWRRLQWQGWLSSGRHRSSSETGCGRQTVLSQGLLVMLGVMPTGQIAQLMMKCFCRFLSVWLTMNASFLTWIRYVKRLQLWAIGWACPFLRRKCIPCLWRWRSSAALSNAELSEKK